MKKIFALAFTGIFLTLLASCGSSNKAHCDAYSDASTIVEKSDLADNN